MASPYISWDTVTEQTAVTSNPAAGVNSVDVKTFTGRGRVTAINCTCQADANVATRYLEAQKVSGAVIVRLAFAANFAATTLGQLYAAIGYATAQGSANCALPFVDFAPGDILRVVTQSGQAGDDMSAITYCFKEML